MSKPTILVTGATGLLGPYLLERARSAGQALGLARSGTDIVCDLTDATSVREVIRETKPNLVIHAAAMSDVDVCERDPDTADRINRGATQTIADALPNDAFLVFFSSIAVYPDTTGPHTEDGTDPVNVYGHTKLAGESAALTHTETLVLRTAMFGPSRNPGRMSLSDFILSKLQGNETLPLFEDELFSPLHVETLADITIRAGLARMTGVFNAASHDGMSKADFGRAIAVAKDLPTTGMHIVNSRRLPGRVRRALDMRLDPARLEATLGGTMPSLTAEIARL
jgi:dTDP-4-dehydrorhamnose reductase